MNLLKKIKGIWHLHMGQLATKADLLYVAILLMVLHDLMRG